MLLAGAGASDLSSQRPKRGLDVWALASLAPTRSSVASKGCFHDRGIDALTKRGAAILQPTAPLNKEQGRHCLRRDGRLVYFASLFRFP